jgi:hypothetical protein
MARSLSTKPASHRRRRRAAWTALVLGVAIVHGCVTEGLVEHLAVLRAESAAPARIEVAYVREMELSAPPPAAAPAALPPPPVAPRVARVRRPKPPKAASAPVSEPTVAAAAPAAEPPDAAASSVASSSQQTPDSAASAIPPVPVAPAASEPGFASAAAAPASAASAAAPFDWPTSTRVSYGLTGNYRGEVTGSAQVEWLRQGSHYQVHLDLYVGPQAAPIIARRMSSDGEITADGLAPRRYDQDTKVVLREPRRVTMTFEPGVVVLGNGERRDAVPGVQDTASQFIQLLYVFSTHPERLRIGRSVDIPLALPHKVDVWTYDVAGEEVLATTFGPLPTIHLKPRKVASGRGELSAEIWFAPQLRYMPVRFRIMQDEQTYIDLLIAKPPDIAG